MGAFLPYLLVNDIRQKELAKRVHVITHTFIDHTDKISSFAVSIIITAVEVLSLVFYFLIFLICNLSIFR